MKGFKRSFLFIAVIFLSLTMYAQPKPGELAYEIALTNPKGDTVSLSALQGKVVLIDFWASWCGPCRMSNKYLVKLYSKYKSKGFEIFGVSLDEDKKDWVKAINKDKISWSQVIDDRGWQAATAIDWNLYQIPTSYLINKDGIIVGVDLERNDLEKALKELLGQ
ncbi:MAG: TlpA disulfide reductase family protein [Bacteroidota bacterium]